VDSDSCGRFVRWHVQAACECSRQPFAYPQDIKFAVHAHPTLAEVLDELFKGAHLDPLPASKNGKVEAAPAKQPVAV
jgi:hypothetical protein